jgi:hypothetical protein
MSDLPLVHLFIADRADALNHGASKREQRSAVGARLCYYFGDSLGQI